MSLLYIGQQVTIYVGLFLVVTGVVGNGINILVFSTVRSYRKTPCTFYFLIASIHSFAYVVINLISRVVSAGFGIDLTRTSVVWCKAREFCLFTLSLITLTCTCLAMIDQFFATSQSANVRRLSNIKWAHRIVIFVISLWCLHGIAPIFLYDISPTTKTCVNTNTGFNTYFLIFLFGLISAIPCAVMVIFGYLTYRNIHLTRVLAEQQADRQLVRMTLIQVVLVLISIVPYAINNAYGIITSKISKDANRLAKESFATTIFNLVTYIYYTESCYVFLISSSRFRRAIKDRILFWRRHNQIIPVQNPVFGIATLENKTYN